MAALPGIEFNTLNKPEYAPLSLCGRTVTAHQFNETLSSYKEQITELDLRDCSHMKGEPITLPILEKLLIGGKGPIDPLFITALNLRTVVIEGSSLPKEFKIETHPNCEYELTDPSLLSTIIKMFNPGGLKFRDVHIVRDPTFHRFQKVYDGYINGGNCFTNHYLYEDQGGYYCIHNDSEGGFPPQLDDTTTLDIDILKTLQYDVMQVRYGLAGDQRRTAWIANLNILNYILEKRQQLNTLQKMIGERFVDLVLRGFKVLTNEKLNEILLSTLESLITLDLRDCPLLRRIGNEEQPINFPSLEKLLIGGDYQIELVCLIAMNLRKLTIHGNSLPEKLVTQRGMQIDTIKLTCPALVPQVMRFQPKTLVIGNIKIECRDSRDPNRYLDSPDHPHCALGESYLCIHNDTTENAFPPQVDENTPLTTILSYLKWDVMKVQYVRKGTRFTALVAKRELLNLT